MQFQFDDYMLDTERRELHRGATPVAVEPQVFDLLVPHFADPDRAP